MHKDSFFTATDGRVVEDLDVLPNTRTWISPRHNGPAGVPSPNAGDFGAGLDRARARLGCVVQSRSSQVERRYVDVTFAGARRCVHAGWRTSRPQRRDSEEVPNIVTEVAPPVEHNCRRDER